MVLNKCMLVTQEAPKCQTRTFCDGSLFYTSMFALFLSLLWRRDSSQLPDLNGNCLNVKWHQCSHLRPMFVQRPDKQLCTEKGFGAQFLFFYFETLLGSLNLSIYKAFADLPNHTDIFLRI
jgi:hypothetical protein